jgi:4-amino-4-deoxy-L-arabinose transferase-like glycosyltransferase
VKSDRVTQRWLVIMLALSVALRVAAAVILGDTVVELPGTFDQRSYHSLALRVLEGHGFTFAEAWWPLTAAGAPTAHWSFLYTLYLVAVYAVAGPHPIVARLIQASLTGLVQPYLAYRLGRTAFSDAAGLVAAALTALYAYFIYYGATLMTEPFFIMLVLGGLGLVIRLAEGRSGSHTVRGPRWCRWELWLLLGAVLGSAVLLRQLMLFVVPVLFAWLVWARRQRPLQTTLAGVLLSSTVIAAVLAPFLIYNAARFGHFVSLNTNSGYAFFWSNHPIHGDRFRPLLTSAEYQSLIPDDLRHLDEASLDQALMRRGLQFVLDDPLRFLALSVSRIPVYFMFWPSPGSGLVSNVARVSSFGLTWPFMLYGLGLTLVRLRKGWPQAQSAAAWLLMSFAAVYTVIHLLSWTLVRYRLPVDGVLLVFAGAGIVDLTRQLHRLRARHLLLRAPARS